MGWITLGIALGVVGLLFVFVRFTTVDEGTAKAVMVFGEFSRIIFRWKKHFMDEEDNIWEEEDWEILSKGIRTRKIKITVNGEEQERIEEVKEQKVKGRIFGGLFVYFWPFQKIHRYKHRWTDIRLQQARMEVEFHEEDLNYVLLKPAVYAFKLTAVETKPPERIPVDVLVLVTLRIRNPYLFLFVAPPTPAEDILARVSAETRALVTSCEIDELLKLKGAGFWELLTGAKVIEDTLRKWGVKLAEKGIEIREIDLQPEYQKAAAARRIEQMRAEARGMKIAETMVGAEATGRGRKIEEIQGEIDTDLSRRQEFRETANDLIIRELSMERDALTRIEVPQGTTFEGLFALLGGKLPGKPPEEKPTEEKEKEAKGEKAEEKTPAGPGEFRKLTKEEVNKLSKEERDRYLRELAERTMRREI